MHTIRLRLHDVHLINKWAKLLYRSSFEYLYALINMLKNKHYTNLKRLYKIQRQLVVHKRAKLSTRMHNNTIISRAYYKANASKHNMRCRRTCIKTIMVLCVLVTRMLSSFTSSFENVYLNSAALLYA